jgi:hypothetical protein
LIKLIHFDSSDNGYLPVVLGDSTTYTESLNTFRQTTTKTLQLVYSSAAVAANDT